MWCNRLLPLYCTSGLTVLPGIKYCQPYMKLMPNVNFSFKIMNYFDAELISNINISLVATAILCSIDTKIHTLVYEAQFLRLNCFPGRAILSGNIGRLISLLHCSLMLIRNITLAFMYAYIGWQPCLVLLWM